MLWLSRESMELACPQAQGGQQMWRKEALTPQEVLEGGGSQALLRPLGSLPEPHGAATSLDWALPSAPSKRIWSTPHQLFLISHSVCPCMLPGLLFGEEGRV